MTWRLMLCAVLLSTGCVVPPTERGEETPSATVTTTTPSTPPKPTASPGPTASSTPSAKPRAESTARKRLRGLTVRPRPRPASNYSRREFGSGWSDTDGNGCNQRDDVLLRDALPGSTKVQRQGRCAHDVLAGTWLDPYNGKRVALDNLKDLRQAQAIQIDHVVPLAEAWVSGASKWPAQRRRQFANDLLSLLAADGPTNASKGAGDPAAWRPKKRFQCRYAIRWINVKHRWNLTVDPSEVAALEDMLDTCSRR